jgi:hypothetical protein
VQVDNMVGCNKHLLVERVGSKVDRNKYSVDSNDYAHGDDAYAYGDYGDYGDAHNDDGGDGLFQLSHHGVTKTILNNVPDNNFTDMFVLVIVFMLSLLDFCGAELLLLVLTLY